MRDKKKELLRKQTIRRSTPPSQQMAKEFLNSLRHATKQKKRRAE